MARTVFAALCRKDAVMYVLEIVWNREFDYSLYNAYDTLEQAVSMGDAILNMGESAKKYRVLDENGNIVHQGY